MMKLSKHIYDLVAQMLQNREYRSILVQDNKILNFLLMAHFEAFCVEMRERYGDSDE